MNNTPNTTATTSAPKTAAKTSNYIGTAILATSSMLSTTFGRKADGRAVSSQIALEKAGILRPIADRVESGLALTESGYRHFKKLAKGEGKEAEGAAKVIEIAKALRARVKDIAAYKADQAAGAEGTSDNGADAPVAEEATATA